VEVSNISIDIASLQPTKVTKSNESPEEEMNSDTIFYFVAAV
jgi:hypothetical protein